MWSRNREGVRSAQTIWVLESAFSQSNADVMKKLRKYVHDLPHLLVVGKIIIWQTIPYRKPMKSSVTTAWLRQTPLMDEGQFVGNFGSSTEYSQVFTHGHTWLSLKSVEIHVWTREPGGGAIDVDSNQAGYAVGVRI